MLSLPRKPTYSERQVCFPLLRKHNYSERQVYVLSSPCLHTGVVAPYLMEEAFLYGKDSPYHAGCGDPCSDDASSGTLGLVWDILKTKRQAPVKEGLPCATTMLVLPYMASSIAIWKKQAPMSFFLLAATATALLLALSIPVISWSQWSPASNQQSNVYWIHYHCNKSGSKVQNSS